MKIEGTLKEINDYMKMVFTKKALSVVRLQVEILPATKRLMAGVYPESLPSSDYLAYEAMRSYSVQEKIQAIKAVREVTGMDLVGAKNFVEKWHTTIHPLTNPPASP